MVWTYAFKHCSELFFMCRWEAEKENSFSETQSTFSKNLHHLLLLNLYHHGIKFHWVKTFFFHLTTHSPQIRTEEQDWFSVVLDPDRILPKAQRRDSSRAAQKAWGFSRQTLRIPQKRSKKDQRPRLESNMIFSRFFRLEWTWDVDQISTVETMNPSQTHSLSCATVHLGGNSTGQYSA